MFIPNATSKKIEISNPSLTVLIPPFSNYTLELIINTRKLPVPNVGSKWHAILDYINYLCKGQLMDGLSLNGSYKCHREEVACFE